MYKIKQIPEDFIVKENIQFNKNENGKFLYFLLTKKNWTTQMAIGKMAYSLKIDERRFSYAGQKDKNAITTQYVAVENLTLDKIKNLKIKDISIRTIGYSDKPLGLGALQSNYFSITVRNISKQLNETC